MDVRLPDGTIIQGVPDGISRADLAARLKSNGMDVPSEWLVGPKGQGGSILGNTLMGVARGAKDVIDTGAEWLSRLGPAGENERVRAMNEAGKREFDQGYGGSTAASIGRIGGNVAATLPAGGVLGYGLRAAAPLAGSAAPVVSSLGNSIATGGMTTGNTLPALGNLATRAIGGGISGGLAAGQVDPNSAMTGAGIGAALPVALGGLGRAGDAIASTIRGPAVPSGVKEAATAALESGYVLPPTQVSPTLWNRLLEGAAGKISTAQNASAKNQAVTNRLAAETLDLPPQTLLSPLVLKDIRDEAGQAYRAVASLPVRQAERAQPLLNKPAIPEINPAKMVEDLKQARNDAQSWFKAYNRSASPDDLAKARAADALSKRLESGLEDYAGSLGEGGLVQNLREARTRIAKTYSVERALNATTGNVDAQVLGRMAQKGVPLSGGLREAANLAQAFPKAAQPVERMGSLPQMSPLDFNAAGLATAASGNPAWLAGLIARPAARSLVLSGPVQRGLISGPSRIGGLLGSPASVGLLDYGVRAAPLLAIDQ